ncbi:hypothetical protein RYH80_02415 [Halobaculum sp. MBLA0147]|uniref:DUF7835 family putative zinc beta-ribbon protein n=1 Tax=Halobaculum sp. MBLA0147 TaxID=3079934 RepID=UPI0035262FDE
MATQPAGADSVRERCGECGHTTSHRVRVEIRTESQTAENAQFSREPYRVSTCSECGTESVTRMNNA